MFPIRVIFSLTLRWEEHKKKELLIYLGPFIILVHQLEKAKCNRACPNSYVCLSISACWKHTSFTVASNEEIWSQKINESSFLSNLYHVVHLKWRAKIFYSSLVTRRSLTVLWFLSMQVIGEAQKPLRHNMTIKSWSISLSFLKLQSFSKGHFI